MGWSNSANLRTMTSSGQGSITSYGYYNVSLTGIPAYCGYDGTTLKRYMYLGWVALGVTGYGISILTPLHFPDHLIGPMPNGINTIGWLLLPGVSGAIYGLTFS